MLKLTAMVLFFAAALCLTGPAGGAARAETTVVCSFYPLRVFAENVLLDVPGVRLETLAPAGTGCSMISSSCRATCARWTARSA